MKPNQLLMMAGLAFAMISSANKLAAQDNPPPGGPGGRGGNRGGGFGDPSEFQARMMENIREQMKVKDDAEWKVLEERIQKITDARREVGFGGGGRMFRRPGGQGGGPGGAGGDNNDGGGRRRGGGFGGFGEPSVEQQALDKAIDSNASKDELKAAMAKVRESKKAKEAKLTAAQEELRKILSTQQEAVALSMGLVN